MTVSNKMTKFAASAVIALSATGIQADVIGATVEVNYWNASFSGDALFQGLGVDLENDLGLDDGSSVGFSASFEHPIPLIPNVRVAYTPLDESANGNFTGNFNGQSFTGSIDTTLDLTHTDLTLYYELLDNYIMLDVGLTVRMFDGQLLIKDVSTPANFSFTEIDEVVPFLFISAQVEMPFTGSSFGGELNIVSLGDNEITDLKIRFRQDISLAFAELGYRDLSFNVEDLSGIDIDTTISGPYLSLGLDF